MGRDRHEKKSRKKYDDDERRDGRKSHGQAKYSSKLKFFDLLIERAIEFGGSEVVNQLIKLLGKGIVCFSGAGMIALMGLFNVLNPGVAIVSVVATMFGATGMWFLLGIKSSSLDSAEKRVLYRGI